MSTVSFAFLFFFTVVLLVYYLFPVRHRWMVLLAGSIFYFWKVSGSKLLLVFLGICLMNFLVGIGMGRFMQQEKQWKVRVIYVLAVVADVAALVLYKDSDFFHAHLAAPVGISYFTLILIGYLTDIYWGKFHAENNFFRFTLFTSYFPQLSSGPFVKYDITGKDLAKPHLFDFEKIVSGMERVLWGFFKKLVIAERLSVLVNTVYGDCQTYSGFYVFVAVGAFTLQLYADFSGAMDIALGVSECFGVELPENFRTFGADGILHWGNGCENMRSIHCREAGFFPGCENGAGRSGGRILRSG